MVAAIGMAALVAAPATAVGPATAGVLTAHENPEVVAFQFSGRENFGLTFTTAPLAPSNREQE